MGTLVAVVAVAVVVVPAVAASELPVVAMAAATVVAVVVAAVAVVVVPAVAALEPVVAVAAATAVAVVVATLSQAVFRHLRHLRTGEMMAAPVTDAAPLVADRALLQSAEAERQPEPMHPALALRCLSAAATVVRVP